MFATAFTSAETVIAFKAIAASEASLETSALVIAFTLFFICSVCLILVILLILIKIIIGRSFGKKLLQL
jgi:hypothetical protein